MFTCMYTCVHMPLDTNAQVSTRLSVCVCERECVCVYTAGHQADDAVEQGKDAHTHKHAHTCTCLLQN